MNKSFLKSTTRLIFTLGGVFILILAQLPFNQVQNVSAQDLLTETPTPTLTEEPTATPTETVPITDVPTLEPTLAATPTVEPLPAETPGFQWELSMDFPSSFDSFESKTTAIAPELSDLGVALSVETLEDGNYRLLLVGGGDTELIRQVIYEILLPDFNFLDSSGIISIQNTTTPDSLITVNLESQPGTGFTWSLNSPDTSPFTLQGTPTTTDRYEGPGTTALQTLILQPSVAGQSTLELIYRRPFDESVVVTRHLSITFPDTVTSIDLSDPNPPTLATSESVVSELTIDTEALEAGVSLSNLPSAFNWNSLGKVSAIRNQGGCGSCWAFGTTAVMESALQINSNTSVDLSEQFLVSCNVGSENSLCGGKYSCAGGCEDAHDYHIDTLGESQTEVGAVLESAFPYTGTDATCPADLTHSYQASSWHFVGNTMNPTVDQIKQAIYAYGPVTSRVCVGSYFNGYTGGVLYNSDGTCANHLIALVGWNDATSSWILRNSWGSGWGESGYMRVGWGVSNTGYMATYVTAPATPTTLISPSGDLAIEGISYSWNAVTGAAGYRLKVTNTGNNLVEIDKAVPTSACSGGTCTFNPGVTLTGRDYKFEVALAGQSTFSSPMTFSDPSHLPPPPPTNDRLAYATTMALNTTYTQEVTILATITSDEPLNVCNSSDTGSVWYKFTAPSTGVYRLSVFGSDYSPNLTVVRQVSSTSRTPVVCGETDVTYSGYESRSELSFNATGGYTYLFEVSDAIGGGNLSLYLEKLTCPTGELCGAVVGGDGRVVRDPSMDILDANGYQGYGYGDYSGFIDGWLYEPRSGYFKVVTEGDGSFMINQNVLIPGYYAPSAVGLPRTLINVLDTTGTPIDVNLITVYSPTLDLGGGIGSLNTGEQLAFYAPASTYNFFAVNDTAGLEIFQPGFNIVSSSNPGTITLDASTLAQDTFTFNLVGITDSYAWIHPEGGNYIPYLSIGSGRTITFAAPAGTNLWGVQFEFDETDISGLNWVYSLWNFDNTTTSIQGGINHAYNAGGTLTVNPYASNPPYRLDEGHGHIIAGVEDAYGHPIDDIYYYGDVTSGVDAQNTRDRAQFIDRITTSTAEDGRKVHRSLANPDLISPQYWVNENVIPSYTVTDALGGSVLTESVYSLNNSLYFYINPWSPIGTWTVNETVNLGPKGGVKSGSSTFGVYSLFAPTLANDDFGNAINITSLPYTITEDTKGGTTASDDPIIPTLNSKGYASAWFKYIPASDGLLKLDTIGSDYLTVLTVWQGARGALKNLAYSSFVCDEFTCDTDAKIQLGVLTGQTYYIEVTQYTTQYSENPNILSLGIPPNPGDDNTIQRIGGSLTLNASQVPCYSLSVTSNSALYGTVATLPAPNCLVTKYADNTEITLTATHKINSGFLNWSDATILNPYIFNIHENKVLQAIFVNIVAPVLTAPANALTTTDTTPDFAWNAVPYAVTYEIQINDIPTFTFGFVQRGATGLVTTTYTELLELWDHIFYWRVRAVNANLEPGPWSLTRSFTVYETFDSQFNGDMTNWVSVPNGIWTVDANSLKSNGLNDDFTTAFYNFPNSDFTYRANIFKTEDPYGYDWYSFGLVIRGNFPIDSFTTFNSDYEFLITNSGYFSIWRSINRTYSVVKPWTQTSTIFPNGWNMLKVYAKGSTMVFYINNIQVFSSTVFTLPTGHVGVMMYRGAEASETMYVDYATLGAPLLGSAQATAAGAEIFGEILPLSGPEGTPKK